MCIPHPKKHVRHILMSSVTCSQSQLNLDTVCEQIWIQIRFEAPVYYTPLMTD